MIGLVDPSFFSLFGVALDENWSSGYYVFLLLFFFQAEDGIRDVAVTGVQTCALPIWRRLPAVTGSSPRGSQIRTTTPADFLDRKAIHDARSVDAQFGGRSRNTRSRAMARRAGVEQSRGRWAHRQCRLCQAEQRLWQRQHMGRDRKSVV